MVEVKVREGEHIEESLKRFKRACERERILQEIKKHEFYKPPSVIRKEKLAESKRKMRQLQRQWRRAYFRKKGE